MFPGMKHSLDRVAELSARPGVDTDPAFNSLPRSTGSRRANHHEPAKPSRTCEFLKASTNGAKVN